MAVGLPYAAITGIWVIGGSNHRTVERRSLSPDGRFEARLQNDVRGSIQPVHWIVYIRPAATRSDDPDASCAVAAVQGEDGWRTVEPMWRGGALELRSQPEAATMPLRQPLVLRDARCAPVPVRIVAQ